MGRIKRVLGKTKKILISLICWFFSTRGLAILLLAGITVNLTANSIEDTIKKQRYLELLEYEINTQLLYADFISKEGASNVNTKIKELIPTSNYYSALNAGYLTSLDQELLFELSLYYKTIDFFYNHSLALKYDRADKLRFELEECKFIATDSANNDLCAGREEYLKYVEDDLSRYVVAVWKQIADRIIKSGIDKFNPTQDRLKSPVLRFLMGSATIQIERPEKSLLE